MIISDKYEKFIKPVAAIFVIGLFVFFLQHSYSSASLRCNPFHDSVNKCNFSMESKNNSLDEIFETTFYRDQDVAFVYSSEIDKGEIKIKLVDSNDRIVYEFEENVNKVQTIHFYETNYYYLIVEGDNASGKFKIDW